MNDSTSNTETDYHEILQTTSRYKSAYLAYNDREIDYIITRIPGPSSTSNTLATITINDVRL